MTDTAKPFRDEYATAKRKLKAAGWVHSESRADETAREPDSDSVEFGSLWTRGPDRFWLNFKTLDMLPGKGKPRDVTPNLIGAGLAILRESIDMGEPAPPSEPAPELTPEPIPEPIPEPPAGEPIMAAQTASTKKKPTASPAPELPTKTAPIVLDAPMVESLSLACYDQKVLCRIPKTGGETFKKIRRFFGTLGVTWDRTARAWRFPADASKLISRAIAKSGLTPPASSKLKPRLFATEEAAKKA